MILTCFPRPAALSAVSARDSLSRGGVDIIDLLITNEMWRGDRDTHLLRARDVLGQAAGHQDHRCAGRHGGGGHQLPGPRHGVVVAKWAWVRGVFTYCTAFKILYHLK